MLIQNIYYIVWLLSKLMQKSEITVLCVKHFRSSRCVCVPSRGEGGCGGLWGRDRGPVGRSPDREPREAEGLLFGLLPWIWSWRPLWEWPGVGLLWELQPRHAMHQRWGGEEKASCIFLVDKNGHLYSNVVLPTAVKIWSVHEYKYSPSKSLPCPVLASRRIERTNEGGK